MPRLSCLAFEGDRPCIHYHRQFLILGNIQAYHWLCGFLHLSTMQLVSQLVSVVYFDCFYSSLCISYIATHPHVCIQA